MNPPLPMASNLPFHLAAKGSQTSKLICESLVGVENAATRQNGSETDSLLAGPIGLGGSGITRSGGGFIAVAEVTVALGILREVRLSQDCCAATRFGAIPSTIRKIKKKKSQRPMLMPPPVSVSEYLRVTYTPRRACVQEFLAESIWN